MVFMVFMVMMVMRVIVIIMVISISMRHKKVIWTKHSLLRF